jgi:two-component system sensor histidine kinase QseC
MQKEIILQRRVDLRSVVTDVLASITERALEKQIELSLNSPESSVNIHGDEATLSILVRNLVDNAIRYTPTGGEIQIRLVPDAATVKMVIADNGPGIPQAKRDELFQRFQRGEGVEEQGSGLGLSIVKQIVELHGAEIALSDTFSGKGLQVTLSFPV